MKCTYTLPARPETPAPIAKARILNHSTRLPATAATISSSRTARSTRANGLPASRASPAQHTATRAQHSAMHSRSNCIGDSAPRHGPGTPLIPSVPLVSHRLVRGDQLHHLRETQRDEREVVALEPRRHARQHGAGGGGDRHRREARQRHRPAKPQLSSAEA